MHTIRPQPKQLFTKACFVAQHLAKGQGQRQGTASGNRSHGHGDGRGAGYGGGVRVECAEPHAERAVVNGVAYGPACFSNPPCGAREMHLAPRPQACGKPPLALRGPGAAVEASCVDQL